MKKIAHGIIAAAIACVFMLGACTAGDTPVPDLVLDVPGGRLITDELNVSFEVASGAAPFTAESSLCYGEFEQARISVSRNRITVELLDDSAEITVTDAAGQRASVVVCTSHPAVQHLLCEMVASRGYGCRNRFPLNFGSGAPYTIVSRDGDTETHTDAIDGNALVCEYVALSDSQQHYAFISDSRGSVCRCKIGLGNGFDITGERLDISVVRGSHLTFPFRWGSGWKVVDGATDALTFIWRAISDSKASGPLCDTFFLVADGDATYEFADRSGNRATLRIEIYER